MNIGIRKIYMFTLFSYEISNVKINVQSLIWSKYTELMLCAAGINL